MKQLRLIALLILSVVSLTGGVFAQEPDETPAEPENNRWIVQFEGTPSENEIEALLSHTGGQTIKRLKLINGRAVRGSESMVAALRTSIMVKRVEKDVIRKATAKPPKPTPDETIPWGVAHIGAETAWSTSTGNGVKVAVLDTGISLSHPDLQANIKGGYNAINPSKPPEDLNGHGSHVSGTIAAALNSIGVAGVAPQASLYAVQVLGASGSGYCSDIIEGLDWSISNGMQVANMSYGGPDLCDGEKEALDLADAAGITLVAAAGNNYGGAVDYPGAYEKVIAVSAINSSNAFASFSSQGSEVDLTAPGVSIPSTYKKGGYKTLSGTSMAAPHVSGVAALVLQLHASMTPAQVRNCLQSTAVHLAGLTDAQQGSGLVNAANAVGCH